MRTTLNRLRKCICLLLVLCLSANLLPMSALAAEMQEFPPGESAPEETEETVPAEPAEDPASFSQSCSMSFGCEVEPQTFTEVPNFYQTDYPDMPYGNGTVATSGCTLTCLSMVASYLRQEEILPDELVKRFGTYESSNIQRMEAASIVLDLPFEKAMSWWETKEALKQGKIAIVLLEPESDLTNIQHTVVATGITPEGRTRIHDPNGNSYKKSALKEGFAEGFEDNMLLKGFSGAWIYDRYEPPEIRESRYPDFGLTEEELYMIASTVWLEARGEPFEGQRAVAEVIFNRLASGKFSKTLRGTILAEGQFRTAKFLEDAQPGELQYKAIEMALSGHNVLPEDVYFFGRNPANKNVWGWIGKHVFCGSY